MKSRGTRPAKLHWIMQYWTRIFGITKKILVRGKWIWLRWLAAKTVPSEFLYPDIYTHNINSDWAQESSGTMVIPPGPDFMRHYWV